MARRGAGTPFLRQLSLLLLLHLGGECGPSCPVPRHPQHPVPSRAGRAPGRAGTAAARAGWGLARAGALPNAWLFLSGEGGPSKGRGSSLYPAWVLRS